MRIPRQLKPEAGSEIDALVAGAGISGLLTAALLLKKGRNVYLLEKLALPGGRLSPETRAGFILGAGFAFGDCSWWRACADRLGIPSPTLPIMEGKALLHHGSKGWVVAEDLPLWESHLSEVCSEFPVAGMYGITESLLAYCSVQPGFSCSFETPVTALLGEGGRIGRVGLGSGHECLVKDVYWAADYRTLLEILGGEGMPEAGPERVSWLKPFVKSNPQPGVVLEFAHKRKIGDFTETLVLPFSSAEKEERRYLVGCLASNRDPSLAPEDKTLSSWVLPLSEAEWGDNHETMKKIRSARRLIEKAFPNASPLFDRVLVLNDTLSPLAKRKGEWKQPLPNLTLTGDWAMPGGGTLQNVADTLLKNL